MAVIMILGFIGSTPICNWNPVEGSAVPNGLCRYFNFIYIFYLGIYIIAAPLNILLLGNYTDVTYWTAKDFIIQDAKESIAVIVIGYLIGGFVGLLIGKIIQNFKKRA